MGRSNKKGKYSGDLTKKQKRSIKYRLLWENGDVLEKMYAEELSSEILQDDLDMEAISNWKPVVDEIPFPPPTRPFPSVTKSSKISIMGPRKMRKERDDRDFDRWSDGRDSRAWGGTTDI